MHAPNLEISRMAALGLKPPEVSVMSKKIDKQKKTRSLVQIALFAALIIVLQLIGTLLIRVGAVAPALAPIPLIIGSIIFGFKGSAILGFVFGLITFICGITGFDVFTNHMFMYKPIETIIICFTKAILAGLVSLIVYKLCIKLFSGNLFPSVLIASVAAPIVNTGVYLLGMASFFKDVTMPDGTAYFAFSESDTFMVVIAGMFMMVIINFILEVIVTPICTSLITSILSKSKQFKNYFSK